jgi:hypothetical protein
MQDRHRAREIAGKRDAGLQRTDEQRLAAGVVARQLRTQFPNARGKLVPVEEDFADAFVGRAQDA